MADSQSAGALDSLGDKPSGSGDLRGSLSVPKDLSELGSSDTSVNANDKPSVLRSPPTSGSNVTPSVAQAGDIARPQVATQAPDKPKRVPLATSESLSDPPFGVEHSMDLTPIQEVSFDSPDGAANDPDSSASSEQQPIMLNKQKSTEAPASAGQQKYVKDKPPVEMILIDRSGKDSLKRMLRIDEHMNVSLYKAGAGSKRAVIGVIVFCALLLVTSLVIILANRNQVNEHGEITSIVESLDISTEGAHPSHLDDWNVWRLKVPPPTETQMVSSLSHIHHELLYLLMQESYTNVRFQVDSSFVVTYLKGCYITMTLEYYVNNTKVNTTRYEIGDPTVHEVPGILITYQFTPPPDRQQSVYLHFDIGFDGFRTYSLFSLYSKSGLLSNKVHGTHTQAAGAIGQSSTLIRNCTGGC